MLKIFICDDEEIHRNRITNIIKNYVMMMDYDVEFQLAADNPYDILSYVSTNKTEGIYFLDIDLNSDINGVELVSRSDCMIQQPKSFLLRRTPILSILLFFIR